MEQKASGGNVVFADGEVEGRAVFEVGVGEFGMLGKEGFEFRLIAINDGAEDRPDLAASASGPDQGRV